MVVSAVGDAVRCWHDLECGTYTADLRAVARARRGRLRRARARSGIGAGRVLDIGAGTGRVALALARDGHRVTAARPRRRAARCAARSRAAGLAVETVRADARIFELERRDFALCLAPMQTLQLLGGTTGRVEFMRRARVHLRRAACSRARS